MQLTKHLSLKEVTRSNTAKKHGIENSPTIAELEVLREVALRIFEPCREFVGKPLYVSSGFRSQELNERIGGSLTSDHTIADGYTGALDLDCDVFGGKTNAELFHYIKDNLRFKQLIWEFGNDGQPDWVHVSYSTNEHFNKMEVLKAKRQGRRTVYERWI